jgi:hypothetical protein
LTCISFILYDVISVRVHNQCSNSELISPVYFGRNVIWHIVPDQKVNANTVARTSFGREMFKTEFASALIYKLHRKKLPESNDQSNENNIFAEDSLASIQLLIIWRFNNQYDFCVRALLIKHSNTITWNEDTLEKLHSMHLSLCRDDDITEDTWLLDDETVLMTTSKWEVGHTVEITISEGTRKDDTIEPLWVSSSM